MSAFCFFILFTLLLLGSSTFVKAQNCAIPSSITLLEADDDARVENATIGTVLGTIQTFNVLGIKPLTNDFLDFSFDESLSEIQVRLKRLLKNELDDKRTKEIKTSARLYCTDGNTKDVVFNVGIRDQNTKCPQFEFPEYNYTINLDASGSIMENEDSIVLHPSIIIRDGDRDFANADVNVTFETQFKNFEISTTVVTEASDEFEGDNHEFEVTVSVKKNQVYDQRVVSGILLTVNNMQPMADANLHCSEDSRTTAKVFIHFESNETIPTPSPEPHLEGHPEFSSFFYYVVIKDIPKSFKGQSLDDIIQPSLINATDPDGIHTVTYRILEDKSKDFIENRNGGILDIDPFNGTMFFTKDLTEEYVNYLKHHDYTEVYRIEAYIAETWLKPTMEFSHVPLFVIYDIRSSGNDTECTTPFPTIAPTFPPTQEPSTSHTTPITNTTTTDPINTTTDPTYTTRTTTDASDTTTRTTTDPTDTTSSITTETTSATTRTTTEATSTTTPEPTDSTSTTSTGSTTTTPTSSPTTTPTGTTTDASDTSTTTDPTTRSTTTTEPTGTPTTTESTGTPPTTESTGTPTTTESTGTPTTTESTGTPTTTEATGSPTTTEPTGTPTTTEATGSPTTTEPTGSPTTTEPTGRPTTTEPTGTPTTTEPTGTPTTTEPTGTPTTTEPTGTPTTTEPTGTPTTTELTDSTTTTPNATTPQTSTTTEIASTTTPKPDCPICSAKAQAFRCYTEGLYEDPHLCNVFHQCVLVNSTLISYRQKCPPYTGFNPASKTCQYPPKCQCSETEIAVDDYSYEKALRELELTTDRTETRRETREETVDEFNGYGYGDDILPIPSPGNNCSNCTCGVCSEVLPGESVCDGTSTLYPDPHSCSVFHSCRSDDRGGYIDCLMPCPDGLLFCPKKLICNHAWAVDCPR